MSRKAPKWESQHEIKLLIIMFSPWCLSRTDISVVPSWQQCFKTCIYTSYPFIFGFLLFGWFISMFKCCFLVGVLFLIYTHFFRNTARIWLVYGYRTRKKLVLCIYSRIGLSNLVCWCWKNLVCMWAKLCSLQKMWNV